jgi:O-antigen/teichoic acid export membrane protein
MVVLGGGMVVRAMAGQAGEVLVVTGRQRESIAIATATLLANGVMTVALIGLFGVLGAAIGTAIAMAGRTLALILVLGRTEKLRVVNLALPRRRAP